jgi:cation transport regulator ChaC
MLRYFAYGSNMDSRMMRRRCPGATPIGPARLDGWRFIIMRGGYGSVVPSAGAVVHGVLWRVTPRDLATLNSYENIDSGLYCRRTLPVRIEARREPALLYMSRDRREGRPQPGYQAAVVASARAWKLPAPYVAELARWAQGRFSGTWSSGDGEPG